MSERVDEVTKRCKTSRLPIQSRIRKGIKEIQIDFQSVEESITLAYSGLVTVTAEHSSLKAKGTSPLNFDDVNYVCKSKQAPEFSEELPPCEFKHWQQLGC